MIGNLQFVINGQEVNLSIDLSQEQLEQICEAAQSNVKHTGWEKGEYGQELFYNDALCRTQKVKLSKCSAEQINLLYKQANCYTNRKIAEDMARADNLLRALRRYAIEHRTEKDKCDFTITYNYADNCLEIGATGHWKSLGDIVLDTEEIAREAMNLYVNELIWYFTEMQDCL